jgi:predicted acylesterase/phospholipase RssA
LEALPETQSISPVPEEPEVFVPSSKFGMPLSFTLRGGVSLGAFEAGYLYYVSEALKRNHKVFDPRLVTGASAGSINAVLFLMALGSPPQDSPQESAFYKVWTALNQKTLLDTENPNTPVGAFSSGDALLAAAEIVREEWEKGLDESFEMVMGMSTTRLAPHEVQITEGLSLPRQMEKFVFRVRGRGYGRAPEITNFIHVKKGLSQTLLAFESASKDDSKEEAARKDRKNFDLLRDVLMASAAFPVGFPPRRLSYCLVEVTDKTDGTECKTATESELYIDGGFFDNSPLRMAHTIASMGLSRDEQGNLIRLSEKDAEDYLYTYLDPDHMSYPPLPKSKAPKEKKASGSLPMEDRDVDVFQMVPDFLGSFIASARAAELFALVEEYPEVKRLMKLTTTDYPIISNELEAFFGFFDREFLRFDFYLGMYSARNYVLGTVEKYTAWSDDKTIVEKLKSSTLPEASMKLTSHWAPFFCMRSWFDGEESLRGACGDSKESALAHEQGGPDMGSFRILLQVALDKLYDHCSMLKNVNTDHPHCKIAMSYQGRPPQVVRPKISQSDGYWKQCHVCPKTENRCNRKRAEKERCVCECSGKKEDENSFTYTMRLLALYGFHFRDLGLGPNDSDLGMLTIRNRFSELITSFADKNENNRKWPILLLGKSAVNFLTYDPPDQIFYISFWSSAELGWSAAFRRTRWLRVAASLFQIRGVLDAFTTKTVAFVPTFGLEGEILPLSSALFQLRLGVRLGYQLSTSGGFTDTSCEEDDKSSSTIYCSFPLLQGQVTASFYERVRFYVGVEWTPPWFEGIAPSENHWVTIIAGLGWQWISPF